MLTRSYRRPAQEVSLSKCLLLLREYTFVESIRPTDGRSVCRVVWLKKVFEKKKRLKRIARIGEIGFGGFFLLTE